MSQFRDRKYRLESAKVAGRQLCVEFFWAADRWAHRILIESGDRSDVLLTSCEGEHAAHWPSSPPLQELQESVADMNRMLLLIGATPIAHWSVSVTTNENAAAFLFDVACRTRQPPEWLGSSYRFESSPCVQRIESAVEVSTNDGRIRLGASPIPGKPIASCAIEVQADLLDFKCHALGSQPLPATHRWQYRVEIRS